MPRDVVPANGPAGDVLWLVEIQGGNAVLPARLNGKNYRRLLRELDAAQEPLAVVLQASLRTGPGTDRLGLMDAGFRAAPKSSVPPVVGPLSAADASGRGGLAAAALAVADAGTAAVRIRSLEASITVASGALGSEVLEGAAGLKIGFEGHPGSVEVRFAGGKPAVAAGVEGPLVLRGELNGEPGTGLLVLEKARLEAVATPQATAPKEAERSEPPARSEERPGAARPAPEVPAAPSPAKSPPSEPSSLPPARPTASKAEAAAERAREESARAVLPPAARWEEPAATSSAAARVAWEESDAADESEAAEESEAADSDAAEDSHAAEEYEAAEGDEAAEEGEFTEEPAPSESALLQQPRPPLGVRAAASRSARSATSRVAAGGAAGARAAAGRDFTSAVRQVIAEEVQRALPPLFAELERWMGYASLEAAQRNGAPRTRRRTRGDRGRR